MSRKPNLMGCTSCPHDVGDSYERDCAAPDCFASDTDDLAKHVAAYGRAACPTAAAILDARHTNQQNLPVVDRRYPLVEACDMCGFLAGVHAATCPQDRCQSCGGPTPCNCHQPEGLL